MFYLLPQKNKTGEYFCVSSQRCEANFVVLRFLGSRPKAAKLQQDFIELLTPRMSEWINYHPPPSGSNGSHNRNSAFRKIADIFEKKEQSRWKSKDHKCQVDRQYINLHSLSFYVFCSDLKQLRNRRTRGTRGTLLHQAALYPPLDETSRPGLLPHSS